MTLSLTELLVVFAVLAASIVWLATLAMIAMHRSLTPARRATWIVAVALTHVAGALAFLLWDRLRGSAPAGLPAGPENTGA